MSLNGLDDQKVKEAHETAAAEPGGWFLLKYASRDEVELLGRGNGGIVEIRNAIAAFEEVEPLFGFLRYRRRNVIIKCLPEECTRLVQARATVHFNAVCERFAPYDTTFSITAAKELKDTKLSAACSLHAASGSTSSSTSSLRRRRLMEIAEEEEEEQRASKRQSVVQEDRPNSIVDPAQSPLSPTSPIPVTLNADLAASPEHSNFAGTSDPPSFVGAPRPASPAESIEMAPRRMSSQSTRPDLYGYSYNYGKPKVKLGPRPSLDVSNRPRTAAGNFRPVSSIPAGFKLFSKGSRRGKAKDAAQEGGESGASGENPEITFAATSVPIPEAPPIPPETEHLRPHTSSGRPSTSSGVSIKSLMPTLATTAKQAMTPEKARLMKAMKLREQKKKLSMMPPASAPMPVPVPVIVAPDEDVEVKAPDVPAPKALATQRESVLSEVKPEEGTPSEQTLGIDDGDLERRLSMSKADSGIVMDVASPSILTDQASEISQSDSHPASPIIASSEPDSTKASSFSESTDETVQANRLKDDIDELPVDENPEILEDAESNELPENLDADISRDLDADDDDKENHYEEEDQDEIAVPDAPETAEHKTLERRASRVSLPISRFSSKLPGFPPAVDAHTSIGSRDALDMRYEDAISIASEHPTEYSAKDVTSAPGLRIPKSKFSSQSLRAAALAAAAAEAPPVPALPLRDSVVEENKSTASSLPRRDSTAEERRSLTSSLPLRDSTIEDNKSISALSVHDGKSETDTASLHSRRSKRKVPIEPIRTDLSDRDLRHSRSDANLSDDDDLMEELQSATVQEAMPIMVAKTPVTPLTSSPPKQNPNHSGTSTPHVVRTVSNPIRGSLLTPTDVTQSSARSISSGAAFLHKITQQSSSQNLAPKTGKIGNSISQRIKALEKLSSNSGPPTEAAPAPRSVPSSTFFSVRKSSVREPSRSPSVAERANSFVKQSPPPSAGKSRESSPEAAKQPPRDRSGSVASKLSMFEHGNNAPRGRPESIQVTARIIRDPSQPFPRVPDPSKEATEMGPLDLKQSPLVVDLQQAEPVVIPDEAIAVEEVPKETIQERRMSKEKRRSESEDRSKDGREHKPRRSSLSIVKDFIKERRKSLTSASTEVLPTISPTPVTPRSASRPPSTHQNSSGFPRRLSISSRRSSISKETISAVVSPSNFTETSGSGDEGRSSTTEGNGAGNAGSSSTGKKKSRAGRFIRRLSSSLSATRGKTLTPGISPTVQEEDASEMMASGSTGSRGSGSSPSIVAYMGDVNVQFPDNLLWKRRSLCVDSQGFLILSAIAATAALPKDKQPAGAGVKRYHLSEFRAPYAPDLEVQELPNSVCLDFLEGSGLQIACEDRAGQLNILHTLQDAHAGHTNFGQ